MDVTEFDVEDVITASGVNSGGGGSNPSPRKNVQTRTGGARVRWTPAPLKGKASALVNLSALRKNVRSCPPAKPKNHRRHNLKRTNKNNPLSWRRRKTNPSVMNQKRRNRQFPIFCLIQAKMGLDNLENPLEFFGG